MLCCFFFYFLDGIDVYSTNWWSSLVTILDQYVWCKPIKRSSHDSEHVSGHSVNLPPSVESVFDNENEVFCHHHLSVWNMSMVLVRGNPRSGMDFVNSLSVGSLGHLEQLHFWLPIPPSTAGQTGWSQRQLQRHMLQKTCSSPDSSWSCREIKVSITDLCWTPQKAGALLEIALQKHTWNVPAARKFLIQAISGSKTSIAANLAHKIRWSTSLKAQLKSKKHRLMSEP